MDSPSMTRKDFITLTLTLVGGATIAGCSSTSDSGGGTGGATGTGGTTGIGGTTGAGGASGTGGRTGNDGGSDARSDAAAVDTANSCADPLPASQTADTTTHSHTLEIAAATLAETTTQSILSGPFPVGTSGAHFHLVMLTPTNLTTLRGGGTVTVTSSADGDPIHSHMFMVSCRPG